MAKIRTRAWKEVTYDNKAQFRDDPRRPVSFPSSPIESTQDHKEKNRDWDSPAEGKERGERLFPAMSMRKTDKAEALKQLRVHVAMMFGSPVASPYLLHYFSADKDKLKRDF